MMSTPTCTRSTHQYRRVAETHPQQHPTPDWGGHPAREAAGENKNRRLQRVAQKYRGVIIAVFKRIESINLSHYPTVCCLRPYLA